MQLLPNRYLTDHQLRHAYPPHEAMDLVQHALDDGNDIEGLNELRQWMTHDLDSEVLAHIERSDWLLIDRQAQIFDWALFAEKAEEERGRYDLPHTLAPKWPFSLYFIVLDGDGVPAHGRAYSLKLESGLYTRGEIDDHGLTQPLGAQECENITLTLKPQTKLVIA